MLAAMSVGAGDWPAALGLLGLTAGAGAAALGLVWGGSSGHLSGLDGAWFLRVHTYLQRRPPSQGTWFLAITGGVHLVEVEGLGGAAHGVPPSRTARSRP